MKLAEKVIALYEGLNKETLKAIVTEVTSSYSKKEMSEFGAFKDFFAAVDVQNAYEEEWNPKKYKPYYEEVWKQYKKGELTDFSESKIAEDFDKLASDANDILEGVQFKVKVKLNSSFEEGSELEVNDVEWDEDSESIFVNCENLDTGKGYEFYLTDFVNYIKDGKIETEEKIVVAKLERIVNDLESEQEELSELEDIMGRPEGILHVIEDVGVEASIYAEYSGRGMYGDKCFGIVVSGSAARKLEPEFKKMRVEPRGDGMGLDQILYWPRYTIEMMKKADENGVLDQLDSEQDDEENDEE